ncbi:hypothetical protein [Bradyrhizobium sp. LVM 105]|uniref:portal protein n=1 Tax=Bradyrhizobium sp. LVM 105 TaxID=2341115 RepID=UPI000F807C3D|nr:hypothetical protein [Bradyrhizobium sp. LVM 105]
MDALAPQAMPAALPMVLHDITVVNTKKQAQVKVMGVPPEEFGIERGARTIKDCNYCFHESSRPVGDLIGLGYDAEQVKGIASSSPAPTTEDLSRDSVDEERPEADSLNEMARLVRVTEHYIRMDYEGNGKPCIYRVTTAGEGGMILKREGKEDIERVDEYPFAAASPVPQSHRFFGRSVADLVMDIQRIKTALIRGLLDNVYQHNNARTEIAESHAGPNTLDDLLVSRPGGIVRTKTPGGLNPLQVQDITGSVYPALQYMDATREMRTGVSNQSQGIDANALQNQSATAVAQVFSASQMRTKLIARILAEGVRDMFALLHATIRKHGQQAETVRLRNTWVEVNPRNWKTRNDMTINVGLGSGGKAQQFAQAMAIANFQKELLMGGKTNLVDDKGLYNTGAELLKIMGHKNPDKFLNDPSAKDPQTGQPLHPPVPPPPDPALIKVQADAQMKDKELQMRGQEIVANAEIAKQADERKAQIESVQAQADIATQNRKTEAEMALAQQKFELERELKLLDFQLKKQMHDEEMQMRREQHQQAMAAGAFKVVAGAEAHGQKMEQMRSKPESGE